MIHTSVPGYFKTRRERLGKLAPGAAFLFPSNPEFYRNSNVEYPYRQDSSFYYLSGFDEPGAFLVIVPATSSPGVLRSILFVRDRDPERELWDGERYGPDAARKVFGVDEAYSITEFDSRIVDLLKSADCLYYRMGRHGQEPTDRKVLDVLERLRMAMGRTGKSLLPVKDPASTVGELRLVKGPEEIECMRKAAQASAAAHRAAMEQTKPGMTENEIFALVEYVYRSKGCKREGYVGIVGGGKHSTCLHYRANDDVLKDGDVLLIDSAGEYDYYTADITRTYPVGRKFTAAQAKIYDLVLKAQMAAIQLVKPGVRYSEFHKTTTEIITDGLLSLGILKGNRDEILKTGGFKRFFPHGTGHWLGMDVHDQGLYLDGTGQHRVIEAGMVFTVEPGIYFQPTDTGFPPEYKHVGIRIEDDILVTPNGCEVLSKDAPKAREEIEALRAKAF